MLSTFSVPYPYVIPILNAAATTWSNMPAALTELSGNAVRRQIRDLPQYAQFRFHVNVTVAGLAGSKIGVQYSLDGGMNWSGLDNGTAATISTLTQATDALGTFMTEWVTINSAARINGVMLRIVGQDGNGAADPDLSNIVIECK
jgi:hypothetical protein